MGPAFDSRLTQAFLFCISFPHLLTGSCCQCQGIFTPVRVRDLQFTYISSVFFFLILAFFF